MKVRNLENLPVVLECSAQEMGRVLKGVIGDNFKLAYVVIKNHQDLPGIILANDFVLSQEAVMISDPDSIKSYAHGEESTIYEKKIGDTLFDAAGRELGVLSDFIINPASKKVKGVELSAGVIKDILSGRSEISLQSIKWASEASALIDGEGSDMQ